MRQPFAMRPAATVRPPPSGNRFSRARGHVSRRHRAISCWHDGEFEKCFRRFVKVLRRDTPFQSSPPVIESFHPYSSGEAPRQPSAHREKTMKTKVAAVQAESVFGDEEWRNVDRAIRYQIGRAS